MPLLQLVIDVSGITATSFSNPFATAAFLFINGGWVIVVPAILWGLWQAYVLYIQLRYDASIEFILLAIDVPKENEQSPKAVEQIFAHLSGIQKKANLVERFIHGYNQQSFSLELVSIGGYIQFIIRTPKEHRDLVEAAVYAQYPDAEISEIDDYVPQLKPDFPNEYNLWGTEFKLTGAPPKPIRTYPSFEHTLSQKFLDPMASTLEIMSRLRPGEQIWLQLNVTPTLDDRWREAGERLIRKLIKAKVEQGGGGVLGLPGNVALGTYETLTRTLFEPGAEERKQDTSKFPTLMQHLPPNEKAVVESIGIKISKIAYEAKFRFIYFAHRSVFDKSRVPAVVGAIKQLNTLDLNGLIPNKKISTKIDYFMIRTRERWRKAKLYYGYRARSMRRGQKKLVLNVEELATIYHFPVMDVKAPLVKRTESKRSEPPLALPVAPPEIQGAVEAPPPR
ncbi:MAG: hypothetical protein HYZ09_01670 [Candidatus Kerfeldbacteria bacterium]|nr:hypothetical protein [Candidatus Kerfeldbacteria bacterium]